MAVSRTFGDIEAKEPKYGGKLGVVVAVPEIKQFKIDEVRHGFISIGSDGIFDALSNKEVGKVFMSTLKREIQ